MISIRYRLTEFMFRHFVKPMMKNAATEPKKFFEKQLKRQQSVLPLKKLHRKYNFEEREANGTVYYAIRHLAAPTQEPPEVGLLARLQGLGEEGGGGPEAVVHRDPQVAVPVDLVETDQIVPVLLHQLADRREDPACIFS